MALFCRGQFDADLQEEMRLHQELREQEQVERGVSSGEAHYAVQRRFGNKLVLREEGLDMWGWNWLEQSGQDLRFASRNLLKDRGFILLAVFTLALGMGATTVIFSVVDGALLHPFPYRDANDISIFRIHNSDEAGDTGRLWLSVPEFLDYREQNHVFADMTGTGGENVLYTAGGATEDLSGAYVTANTFMFLGVRPLLGRYINPDDGKPSAPSVFVMNYRMWQGRFHGDRSILGRTFTLNGVPRTLVGIMPPRFQYFGADVWLPLSLSRSGVNATGGTEAAGRQMYLIPEERRKPGVSLEAVAADLSVIAQRLAKVFPNGYPKRFSVQTDTLASDVVGGFKTMLYILLAAVGMLLLIACSNVANLLLARSSSREKEIAVRAALGASRARLIRQLLVESLALAAAGGTMGCLFAYGGLKAVMAVMPPGTLPSESVIELNAAVLLFATVVAVVTTLLVGLAPALHAVRGELHSRLKDTSWGVHGSSGQGRFRAGLVVAEVALSVVLLAGAGLLMRSFFAVEHVDLGFDPANILAAEMVFPQGRYQTPEQNKIFFQQLLPRISALPGVVSAAETVTLPPFGGPESEMTIPGKTHTQRWDAMLELCSQGWFRTVGVPLLRGRLLSADDVNSAQQTAVINQTLARRYFGKEDPIGHKIKFKALESAPGAPHDAAFEIVGIIGDTKNDGLEQPTLPEAFVPYTVSSFGRRGVLVRTASNPAAMQNIISRAIWSVDPNIAIGQMDSLPTLLKDYAYAQPRFGLVVLGVFAALGLMLVVIGVFSVMAYSVSLRTHDIGIRMALGAQKSDVLRFVIGQGMIPALLGLSVGIVGALALTRFLSSMLYGVKPTDMLTFIAVSLILIAVALLACYIPARRAAKVDPMVALRYE
ncbi:MAG TPA: ABC transporter permease [Terriglobia bacterium]|nr:ABC transporter permease [Terriglobia bacterium]